MSESRRNSLGIPGQDQDRIRLAGARANAGTAVTISIERAEAFRAEAEQAIEPFDPSDERDGRLHVLTNLVRRQGQAGFRRAVLRAYGGRCAITGCDVEDVLEAAHIMSYRGEHTSHVTNGLLLRSDLHALFDLYLIAIDADSYSVIIGPRLADSLYAELGNKTLRLPKDPAHRPQREYLRERSNLSR